ncbi:MAG: translation initiation factor IF-2 subunit alpha [Candidatus Ranarchaeia archaeon]|jgi:translation initiation factor 2 subunit 1
MNNSVESLPESGELVITTIKEIKPYGAYATLDEYENAEGLLHVSEISSRWVKNIRDHIRERQKSVLKVLRVDPEKRHIDLSLRRVNERERKEKLLEWKQERRGRTLFDMAAEKLKVDRKIAYDTVGRILEERFGSLYASFEKAALSGEKTLIKAKIPSEWVKAISEIAELKIKISLMKVKGTLELTCYKHNGVEVLRDAFNKAKDVRKPENAMINIYVTGTPKYRIEVFANTYKEAEKVLERATNVAIESVHASGGKGNFIRRT